jgi:SNF2 family DNA or RNA helicase
MKLVEHLRQLPTRVRVIISGTPIQNNLMEMHSLFDFTTPGLLADPKTFRR